MLEGPDHGASKCDDGDRDRRCRPIRGRTAGPLRRKDLPALALDVVADDGLVRRVGDTGRRDVATAKQREHVLTFRRGVGTVASGERQALAPVAQANQAEVVKQGETVVI